MFLSDVCPTREGDIQKDPKVADVANGRKMFIVQQRSEQISEGHREISSHVGKTLKYFCSLVSRLYSDITSQIGFLHSLQLERDFSRDVVGEVKLRLKRVRSCEGEI